MASLSITIKPKEDHFSIEMDLNKLEKLAASLGFFNPDFVKSLERAESEQRAGRIKKISSLRRL